MRIRRFLLAGALVGCVAVMAVPQSAFAATDHNQEVFECVEKAIDNNVKGKNPDYAGFKNDLDDCNKAKSLVSPALPEIVWGGLAFLIVLAILMKFAFPALKKGLKQREETIREELEGASRAREEAEAEAAQYRAQIGDARSEANTILEDARADAERIRREMLERAENEAADVRQRAQEDIRLAQERAVSDLRSQVTDLSIDLAERVVEQNLDRATQVALIDRYIDSIGDDSR
jgi:F-type H+-transporting ATPase subunit b